MGYGTGRAERPLERTGGRWGSASVCCVCCNARPRPSAYTREFPKLTCVGTGPRPHRVCRQWGFRAQALVFLWSRHWGFWLQALGFLSVGNGVFVVAALGLCSSSSTSISQSTPPLVPVPIQIIHTNHAPLEFSPCRPGEVHPSTACVGLDITLHN